MITYPIQKYNAQNTSNESYNKANVSLSAVIKILPIVNLQYKLFKNVYKKINN